MARGELDLRDLGGLHGIYLAAERGLRARLAWHPGPAGLVLLGLLTFVLTNLAWGFFHAKSFGQAGMILGSMFGHGTGAVPMMAAIYWRPGVRGPYDDVWKMQVANDERQAWLWPALEHDARLRAHARATWIGLFAFARPTPPLVAMTAARTRDAVARIRARGGEVVFVRPPSAPPCARSRTGHCRGRRDGTCGSGRPGSAASMPTICRAPRVSCCPSSRT